MKLEDQVCSLELSKRLKELNVKQESFFVWEERPEGAKLFPYDCDERPMYAWFSAFTVAELGEFLPSKFEASDEQTQRREVPWYLEMLKHPEHHPSHETPYYVAYWNHCERPKRVHNYNAAFSQKNEADARGKMLAYLIETNLIKIGG